MLNTLCHIERTSYTHGDGQMQSGQVEGSPFAKTSSSAHLTARIYRIVKLKTAILQKDIVVSYLLVHHSVSCQPLSDSAGLHSHKSRTSPFDGRNSDRSKKNIPFDRKRTCTHKICH